MTLGEGDVELTQSLVPPLVHLLKFLETMTMTMTITIMTMTITMTIIDPIMSHCQVLGININDSQLNTFRIIYNSYTKSMYI